MLAPEAPILKKNCAECLLAGLNCTRAQPCYQCLNRDLTCRYDPKKDRRKPNKKVKGNPRSQELVSVPDNGVCIPEMDLQISPNPQDTSTGAKDQNLEHSSTSDLNLDEKRMNERKRISDFTETTIDKCAVKEFDTENSIKKKRSDAGETLYIQALNIQNELECLHSSNRTPDQQSILFLENRLKMKDYDHLNYLSLKLQSKNGLITWFEFYEKFIYPNIPLLPIETLEQKYFAIPLKTIDSIFRTCFLLSESKDPEIEQHFQENALVFKLENDWDCYDLIEMTMLYQVSSNEKLFERLCYHSRKLYFQFIMPTNSKFKPNPFFVNLCGRASVLFYILDFGISMTTSAGFCFKTDKFDQTALKHMRFDNDEKSKINEHW
jgi:hypothetical protein